MVAIHSARGSARAVVRRAAAGLALAAAGAAASAQTLSLTPEEKARVLAQNTEASVDAARAGYADTDLSGTNGRRAIHGEVGVTIGSNGTRGAYGVAAIPLGDSAGAVVSFDSEHYGYGRGR